MELRFYLLGPPYVTWNDSVLEIPRRQVRGLLYYLATYSSAIPQERLHYLFWDDKPEATCRRNLSHLLTHVRNLLPDKEILITKNSLIMLDFKMIWCDVIEFRKLIQTSKDNDPYGAYQQAVMLYRGPYLDGVQLPGRREFEYLVERERFNLERNHLNLLYKLIMTEMRQENYGTAIEYAYQYLAIDNLSEDVHRQIIVLYGLTGRPERAVEQYKVCEELLEQELQTKVSEKTHAALQDVLSERVYKSENTNEEVPTTIRPVRTNPTIISKDHLAQLDSLITGSQHGPWGIALLKGELGVGKSSLLTKYLEKFKDQHLILYTKCDPGSHSIQYWPVRQICFNVRKSRHPALKDKPDVENNIEQCLIYLANGPTMAKDNNHPGVLEKERNFSLLFEIISHLSEAAGGLILCIEDLEWADESTLDFILYLCNFLREKKILIIGSYCCEGEELLANFFNKVQVTDDFLGVVYLQGIGLDSTLSLVKYWLGNFEGAPVLAEKLHHISAGNPLFLTETLRWIMESELPVSDIVDAETIYLPTTISKVIDFRLNSLNQIERKVLDAIAVRGHMTDVDQIVKLTGLSVLQIFDVLDKLVARHLLVAQSTTYQFRHEIVRQSILEAMSPVRRQFLKQICC